MINHYTENIVSMNRKKNKIQVCEQTKNIGTPIPHLSLSMCFLKAAHLSSFFFFSGNIKRKANLYESLKGGEDKKKWL